MGFLNNQFANVVEWEQFKDDMIFWKWDNKEIKKGSKLIIKPGQDAIFMFNGKVEGVFTDEGAFMPIFGAKRTACSWAMSIFIADRVRKSRTWAW